MSAVLLARIDMTLLYPPFLRAVTALLDEAFQQGTSYWAVSGFRTYGEQMALWAQGRTTPGAVVTRAKGGESAHNFGVAVDLARDGVVDRTGLQPDYRPESYEMLGALAPKHGLVWGGSWARPDRPHVQMPGYVTSKQMDPLRYCYELGGLPKIFAYLDQGVCQ